MKLTNKYDLPRALVKAAEAFGRRSPQPKRRISVTQLIGPARIRQLERTHFHELTEDVTDRIWAIFGSAVHVVLEKGAHLDSLAEEKLEWLFDDFMVTGVPDLYEGEGRLLDWKVVGVRSLADGVKDEWTAQLNVYAELYRQHGFVVTTAAIVALFRDWTEGQRMTHEDYPPRVGVYPVQLWPSAQVRQYISSRLTLHRLVEDEYGDVDCTEAERWARPTKHAVMLKSQKRAKKLLDTREAAEAYIADKLTEKQRVGASVVARLGQSTRCSGGYCRVAQWCPQWAQLQLTHREEAPGEPTEGVANEE